MTSASAAPVTTNDYWKIVFDEGIDAPNNYSTTFTPKVRLYDQGNNLVTDGALSCSYYDVNARQSIPCTVNNNGDGSYSGSAIDMQARIGHYINVQFSVSAGSNIIREGHVFYAGESYAARGALWKIEVFDTSSGPSWDGASTQNVYMKLYSDAATLISNNFQTPTIIITNAAGLTQATGNMVYEGHGVYSYSISGYTNGEYYFEIFNRWSGAPTGGKNQYVETYAGLYLEANNAQGDESSPEIVSIERDPYFPVDNDYVDITVYAVDNVNIVSATLNYSVNNQQFQTVPMVAQSGIEYIGQLSPHLLEDNVRYSVEINDGTGIASSEWFMYNVQDHRGEPNMTHSFLNHPVYWFGKTRQAALGDVGGDANYDGTYSTNAGDIDGVVYLHFAQDYQYFRDQTFIKVQTLVMDETGKPLEHLTNVTAWLSPNATQAPGTHNMEKIMTEVPGETGVYTTTWEGSPAILSGGSTYVWNDDARAIWGQYTSGEIYSVYIDIGDGGIPEENITWLAYNFGDTFWNSGAEGKGLSHVESTKSCNKDCHGMAGTVRGDMTCPDCHGVYKAANNGNWPVDTGNDAVDTAIVYGNGTGHPRQDVINKTTCGDDTCHDVAWGSTPVPNDVIIPGYIMGAQIDETFQSDYPNTAQCGEHHNYNSLKIPIEAGHNRMITCKYCHGGSHSNNRLADYDILNTDVSAVDRGTPGYVADGDGGETNNTMASDCYIDCHKTQVEHSLVGMPGGTAVNVVVPCDECHENYNNAPAHQESLAPYSDRETCGSCHQAEGALTAYNTSFILNPPRIPQTQLHAQESGTMWNNTGTRPYWVENEQSCRYCHGRSYNEAYGMGRIKQFMGTNIINGSIDSNSYWCASCHVDNATDIHYDYNSMVEVYNYTFGVVPPEITGSTWMSTRIGYDDHQLSGYLDRSNSSTYSDIICFSCHGSLLSLSDGMDVFQHEVSPYIGDDTADPVIISVTLNTTTPNTGEDILVTVNTSDDTGVINVEAEGITLNNTLGDVWEGIIVAVEGIHFVNVSSSDAANNITWDNSTSYNATTSDTTDPVWNPVPSDQTVEIGTSFSYTVNADDASAVTYSINDTANFNINPSTGDITNVTILSVGGYGLNITATDASMNSV
ncbi:MAG: cadherin repeat domain-containing protein, partial [Methanosarcinales archaeon]|nr:cadherin repeat domain-containing protein [Methanosarcinales archaeon]